MAIDFRAMMSKESRDRHAAADQYYDDQLRKFASMSNENLAASAKYYMTQMREPWKHERAVPTYDAVFWHTVIPELLKRVQKCDGEEVPE